MLTDREAVDIFKALRDERFSHKGSKHDTMCESRAYRTAQVLEDRFQVGNVRKIWVFAEDENGEMTSINSPESPYSFLERLQGHKIEYNFHVAPILETQAGRELVFDTKTYENPPEVTQWLKDFSPAGIEDKQRYVITPTSAFLFQRDVIGSNQLNLPAGLQNMLDNLSASFCFWAAPYQRHVDPVQSEWYGSDPRGGDSDHEVHVSDFSF